MTDVKRSNGVISADLTQVVASSKSAPKTAAKDPKPEARSPRDARPSQARDGAAELRRPGTSKVNRPVVGDAHASEASKRRAEPASKDVAGPKPAERTAPQGRAPSAADSRAQVREQRQLQREFQKHAPQPRPKGAHKSGSVKPAPDAAAWKRAEAERTDARRRASGLCPRMWCSRPVGRRLSVA